MYQTVFIIFLLFNGIFSDPEEEEGVKYASKCEGKSFV